MTFHSLIAKAQRGRYALGAFNVSNLEFLQAITSACEAMKSPAIISTTEGAISYSGVEVLKPLIDAVKSRASVPLNIHLDHGRDFDIIRSCINHGYDSVMYDGSHLPFDENVRNTRKVVALAHRKGVGVEGELGTIGGAEDTVSSRHILYTDPHLAHEFIDQTGVDALAVAIGTSHGAYKFSAPAHLDIPRLKLIRGLVNTPLVLHGASEVPAYLVKQANKYGARISGAHGVPDGQVRLAVKNGIAKVNEDTDLRLAFIASLRKTFHSDPSEFDPRKILGPAKQAIQKVVEDRIKILGSRGKA